MNKLQSWNIITLFCILIFGFTLATMIKPDTEYSETENRTLAQMPRVSAESVFDGTFESDYETYLTDQFVARDGWIGMKTAVERMTLRRESKDIYFAEDDYLIEKHTDSFTSELADRNIQTLAEFISRYQDEFGKEHMTVMLIPNAVEILSDKLPPYAELHSESDYLWQAEQALPKGVWFDTETVLQAHDQEALYYRTDHHWTTLAAFYVYQAWAEEQDFAAPVMEDYTIETVTTEFAGTIQSKLGVDTQKDAIQLYHSVDDIFYELRKNGAEEPEYSMYDYTALNTKSKYDIFFGGNYAKVAIKTKQETGRKLLVIKDSYAHCFVPFLIRDYEEITMLDVRYYNQKVSELIASEGYTDLLFLYNVSGFAEDTAIARLAY